MFKNREAVVQAPRLNPVSGKLNTILGREIFRSLAIQNVFFVCGSNDEGSEAKLMVS